MLRYFIILLSVFTQLNYICFAFSEWDIDEIEYIKYGTVYANEELSTRLRRLEKDTWGMSQSGDLENRLANLKKIIIKSNNGNKFEETGNNKKIKNPIKSFFNNLSEMMESPVMTGYTPSVDYYKNPYPNSIYKQNYMNFLNNGNSYCSYPNGYSNRRYYDYYGYNRNTGSTRKKPNRYHRHPYQYNREYNQYSPTDILNNYTSRSSVHILQD